MPAQAIRAQGAMPDIQNTRGISYAGAWLKYGFHEDGFTSGLKAALSVGGNISPPFDVREADLEPQPVFVATIFDVLEHTGARTLLGSAVGFVLDVLAATVPIKAITALYALAAAILVHVYTSFWR